MVKLRLMSPMWRGAGLPSARAVRKTAGILMVLPVLVLVLPVLVLVLPELVLPLLVLVLPLLVLGDEWRGLLGWSGPDRMLPLLQHFLCSINAGKEGIFKLLKSF